MERLQLEGPIFKGSNAFLFNHDRVTLVDTGVRGAEEQLISELGAYGLSIADIDQVLLTHYHGDHSGLASTVQEAGGASIHVHEADASIVSGGADRWLSLQASYADTFEQWGIPEGSRDELYETLEDSARLYGGPADVKSYSDGDVFSTGETRLSVMHVPGHTAGQSAVVVDDRVLLAGDALLSVYTPNIGADIRLDRPLEQYLAALEHIVNGDFDAAWPGHRDRIDHPTERAIEIAEHHRQRAWEIMGTLRKSGEASVWEVSHKLFGELSEIHILQGTSEVAAHLNHLTRTDAVEATSEGYELIGDVPDSPDELDQGIGSLFDLK